MGFLSVGGVFRSVRSLIPVRLISSVRGIGVAVSVRTSTLLFKDFIFSLWDTPNRCSSSIISKPRSLYSMSSDRSRCVPITRSTSPSLTLEMISLASFWAMNLLSTSTFMGKGLSLSVKVWYAVVLAELLGQAEQLACYLGSL